MSLRKNIELAAIDRDMNVAVARVKKALGVQNRSNALSILAMVDEEQWLRMTVQRRRSTLVDYAATEIRYQVII